MDLFRARFGLSCALLVALPVAVRAQAVKLNAPLAQPASGDVVDYLVSPDGARVVYRSDEESDGVYELYSAPADGSAPTVKLNDPLPAGANVGGAAINIFGAGGGWDYALSSTGRAVFLTDQNTNNVDELYSVPLDGSASPVRLNGPLVTGGVWSFSLTSDGAYVVYRADEQDAGNLFRAPLDGSAPRTLLAPGLETVQFWLSPDGSTTVFSVVYAFTRQRLYSVPSDGSAAPILLGATQPPISFGVTAVSNVRISDDNTHAVFHHVFDEDGDLRAHLVAVPLDASHSPWVLSQNPVPTYSQASAFDGAFRVALIDGAEFVCVDLDGTQRVTVTPPGWTPDDEVHLTADGTRVVFDARNGPNRAVFQAPCDGSQPALQLSAAGPSIGQIALAGATVVYSSGTSLYAVPLLGGSGPVLLNPAPFGNNTSFQLHPGGLDVVFRSEGGLAGVSQLFTAPLDASALPRKLSAPLIAAGDVAYPFVVAADGEHVVYLADQNQNETFELFGAPFAGGAVLDYNAPIPSGPVVGDVTSFQVTAGEQRVVYRADQDLDDAHGLFSARSDGRGAPLSLTTGLPDDRSVFEGFAVDPGGTRVAFLQANSPGSAAGFLYSCSIVPPSLAIPLDLGGNGTPMYDQPLAIDASGTFVLYLRRRLSGAFDLRGARLNGATPSLMLSTGNGSVVEFQLAPDGSAAFFRADQGVGGVIQLYRVPVDGSAASVQLNTTLTGGADVSAFSVAPDGLHVVYLADANLDEQFELYSVPSDGSGPSQLLSDPLVAGGDVREFVATPDGAYVVYRADSLVDQTFELFRAPLAGGAVVRLTAFGSGSVNDDFTTTADGLQVLFRATPNAPARQELFRVPADGSASPVQLSGNLVAGGSVSAFALAPDQLHLVYLADERVDNVMELNGVPLGGGPSVVLHTLPATGDVSTFRIAADSSHVVYRADASQNGVFELFSAPLDASRPPERLSRPLPVNGNVSTAFVPLTAGRAVYVAEQEADNVLELFTAFPEHAPRPAATPTVTHTVVR